LIGQQSLKVLNGFTSQASRQRCLSDSGDLEEMKLIEKSIEEIDSLLLNGDVGIIHHAAAWAIGRIRAY